MMRTERRTGFVERGIPKVKVVLNEESAEEIVKTVLELAHELKRETIANKIKGTTPAKVIPFRKGPLKN